MGQLVKVKIRPGKELAFPGVCVNCARAASEWMTLRKRTGRLTRYIDVPLCSDCARELGRMSGEEERWLRLGRLAAIVAAFLTAALVAFLLVSLMSLVQSLIIALAVAILMAVGLWSLFRKRSLREARPEKVAILNAAQMKSFSWRATTFEFENAQFADQFIDLHRNALMEVSEPLPSNNDF